MSSYIILNRARCKKCGDLITSYTRHDFKSCSCGNISVDGGTSYLKRSAKDFQDFEEKSVYVDVGESNDGLGR